PASQGSARRHPDRPAELNGLDIDPDGLSILPEQGIQPLAHRLRPGGPAREHDPNPLAGFAQHRLPPGPDWIIFGTTSWCRIHSGVIDRPATGSGASVAPVLPWSRATAGSSPAGAADSNGSPREAPVRTTS